MQTEWLPSLFCANSAGRCRCSCPIRRQLFSLLSQETPLAASDPSVPSLYPQLPGSIGAPPSAAPSKIHMLPKIPGGDRYVLDLMGQPIGPIGFHRPTKHGL